MKKKFPTPCDDKKLNLWIIFTNKLIYQQIIAVK